jgi:hypothetical protein
MDAAPKRDAMLTSYALPVGLSSQAFRAPVAVLMGAIKKPTCNPRAVTNPDWFEIWTELVLYRRFLLYFVETQVISKRKLFRFGRTSFVRST